VINLFSCVNRAIIFLIAH